MGKLCPPCSTGAKGLPVPMMARPSVQARMSAGCASAREVGFDSVAVLLLVGGVGTLGLDLDRLHGGRQQAVEAEQGAFVLGEAAALVEDWFVDQLEAAKGNLLRRGAHGGFSGSGCAPA